MWSKSKGSSGSSERDDKRSLFIEQISSTYKRLYTSIRHVPITSNKVYRVDKVFVAGGIELLALGVKKGQPEKWEKLKSYHDIVRDPIIGNETRFVEGRAGMGKSTLTLQLIYDWCTKEPQSYLRGVEIVILLRLNQLQGVTSISKAIKLFLLPRDSRLSEKDIEDILHESSSVVVILDGFDEYPGHNRGSGVISTLLQRIFQQFDVVVTTRYMPKEFALKSLRFRLTGFDEASRNEYIRKVIASEDEEGAERIQAILRKNLMLNELCNVPMFFVMMVHLAHESTELAEIKTVTELFRLIINSVHQHFESKVSAANLPHSSLDEDKHLLSQLAFEGLQNEQKQTSWQKDEMIRRIGRGVYHKYVKMGILVEEEVYMTDETPGSSESNTIKTTQVKFYHALFNEWYAAHYLSELASRPDVRLDPRDGSYQTYIRSEEDDMLRNLDPIEHEYIFRFASGLNSEASDKLGEYMTTRYGGEQYAMLCALEQQGKTERVLQELEKMSTMPMMFHGQQSRLKHQATIKLLQIASDEDYPISNVWIYNSFQYVDMTAKTIILTSGIAFPVLQTLVSLEFRERGKTFSESEVTAIVQFSCFCPNVKTLKFLYCLMPRTVQAEPLSDLIARNARVLWEYDPGQPYKLDLEKGQWKIDNRLLTDAEYQEEVDMFDRVHGKAKD